MPDRSLMSQQKTFWDTGSVISSSELLDGPKPSASPAGMTKAKSGQDPARARRSAPQEKRNSVQAVEAVLCRALTELAISYAAIANTHGLPTIATYGRSSGDSSPSADLQSSLASRLVERMDCYGSPEYALHSKCLDTALGPQIWQRQALARRTSDNESTGEPAGWVTPSARDHKDTPGMATTGTNPDGSDRERMDQLPRQAHGLIAESSHASTESKGVLDPQFPRWLQAFPEVWDHLSPGFKEWQSVQEAIASAG